MLELHAQGLRECTQEVHQFAPNCKLVMSTSILEGCFFVQYMAFLKPIKNRTAPGQQNTQGKENGNTTEMNTFVC